jgi:hypothetical protein
MGLHQLFVSVTLARATLMIF